MKKLLHVIEVMWPHGETGWHRYAKYETLEERNEEFKKLVHAQHKHMQGITGMMIRYRKRDIEVQENENC